MRNFFLFILLVLSLIVVLGYIPPSTLPSYDFFGLYLGSVKLGDLSLEHEWVGVGFVILSLILYPVYKRDEEFDMRILFIAFLIGGVLLITDIQSILRGNFWTNTSGSIASILFGLLYSFCLVQVLRTFGS